MTTSEATSNLPAQFIPGASRTALELPDGCPIDTWESLMTNLQIVHNGIQWWIGDALEFASKQSGYYYDRALQWVMELGYAKKTVVNYRSIASRIDKSRRREEAEFGLHACIAYIDDHALADLLLSDAINDEWDVDRLREEVRTATGKPAKEPKVNWKDEVIKRFVMACSMIVDDHESGDDTTAHVIASEALKFYEEESK